MTRREELIADHARWYRDVVDPLFAAHGQGSGELPPHMPAVFTRSFREFERCYTKLKNDDRPLFRHFRARYMTSTRARKMVKRSGALYFTPCETGRLEKLPDHWQVMSTAAKTARIVGKKRHRQDTLTDELAIVEMWEPWVSPAQVTLAVRWISGEFQGTPVLPREIVEAA